MRVPRPALRLLPIIAAAAVLAGCASFPEASSGAWHQPPNGSNIIQPPKIPDTNSEQPPDNPNQPGPPNQPKPSGCADSDPAVVATCLNPVSAIAVLPDGQSALAAERSTGKIYRVTKDQPSQLVATVPVDASGGGLIGLVLSPTYSDDQLLYAYIATPSDHRIVRIASGQAPVPILTGIPATPGDSSGAMVVDAKGALLVATGGGGTAGGSLGGKIIRIDTFGRPYPDNPNPESPVYSSGLRDPGGLCVSPANGTAWVTDRRTGLDALYAVTPGELKAPAWNWPDRPGVAGCVARAGSIVVAETGNSALFVLQTAGGTNNFTGLPTVSLKGKYGRLSAASPGPGQSQDVWLGTVNKGGGGPVTPTDDRVIKLPLIPGGGSGGPE